MIQKYYSGGGMAPDDDGEYVLFQDVQPHLLLLIDMAELLLNPPWDRGIEWEKRRLDLLNTFSGLEEVKKQ